MSSESAREYAQGVADGLADIERDGLPLDDDGQPDLFGWLEGVLDVERVTGSDGELRRVRLLVAFGGPNCWVEFGPSGAEVQASWWSDVERVWAACPTFADQVLEVFASSG